MNGAPPSYSEEWGDVDDNGFRLLSRKRVKARKNHICNQCQEPIWKGTTYLKEVFITDDGFGWETTHGNNCVYYLMLKEENKHEK